MVGYSYKKSLEYKNRKLLKLFGNNTVESEECENDSSTVIRNTNNKRSGANSKNYSNSMEIGEYM